MFHFLHLKIRETKVEKIEDFPLGFGGGSRSQ